eukprot:CAMPEP_0176245492 /NCGR_PEP_ID=MMETSP0121_2-20121125/31970_1 /TAXON_ID=160619 /ORGANISM="Kryptoperidinium foliaceum, Strain CCMP 1326" /LENGTH=63 /DNA_ID=CAMNT_0017585123 /DNA_START=120 /DNA_END=311 /DNA_ORIENTATION=+
MSGGGWRTFDAICVVATPRASVGEAAIVTWSGQMFHQGALWRPMPIASGRGDARRLRARARGM